MNILEREGIQLIGVLINSDTQKAQDIYYTDENNLIYKDVVDGYIKSIKVPDDFKPTQKAISFDIMVHACESTEEAVGITYGSEYFVVLKQEDAYCFNYKDLVNPITSYQWQLDDLEEE